MLKSAIRDDDPVLFLENRVLYATQGPLADEEFVEPLGKARVAREGEDLTLIAWLHGVLWAEQAADRLAERGVSVEVVDLRSLQPVDYATLGESIGKTGRAVILHEAIRTGGLGAEIAATLAENQQDSLREPVRRFGAAFVPMPVAPSLVPAVQPQVDTVVEALSGMVAAKG
jgi:pyruvate/2-oxoglutarate/acetoin dehydrogenase E1 component